MKKISIVGLKIRDIQEQGKMPMKISWHGEIPSSYSIILINKEEETIIALSVSFGGQVCWAIVKTDELDLFGKEEDIGKDEIEFLSRKYPELLSEINR